MEVKQVYVTWKNPSKIFSIIEDELLEQINTQIYVKNEIYLAMRKNGYNYHVFSQNYTKGYHYYHTDDENGYLSNLNLNQTKIWTRESVTLDSLVFLCFSFYW